MASFAAKLAKVQNSLQHVVIVVIERVFAVVCSSYHYFATNLAIVSIKQVYDVYFARPGYVTCCGIIGSAMFWICGYLLTFPPKNILSDINDAHHINIHYLASNILPFQTFIHIALLFLASITYWKTNKILSFCMTKCGCLYLFVHSLFSLVLIIKYLHIHHKNLDYDFILFPIIFILWFLISSFIGFISVSKEHYQNEELKYKWKQINTRSNSTKYQLVDDGKEYDQTYINQQYWAYLVYTAIGANIAWFMLYTFSHCIYNLHLMNTQIISIGEWISGYTESFTIAFHRAFFLSVIYNILFRPFCHNTVYIALTATFIEFISNTAYLCTNDFSFNQNIFAMLSFVFTMTKCIILLFLLFFEYKLYKLLSSETECNKTEIVRKRPTMFDILLFDGGLTPKQRKSLFLIVISSTFSFISMQMEVVFMLIVSIFFSAKNDNEWIMFNTLLLWSFHISAIYVYVMVVSVQSNDSYARASKILSFLNAALLIFSIRNICLILEATSSKHVYLDYIVICLCFVRSMTALLGWFGISKLHNIKPFTMPVCDKANEENERLKIRYIAVYCLLLFFYFAGCLNRFEWNGNLFLLNGSNWAIICPQPPLYGFLFHAGFLSIIFIFDAGISRRWAPTLDLSRFFLASIVILGFIQVASCLIWRSAEMHEYLQMAVLLCLMIVSAKMCKGLYGLDSMFPFDSHLFI